MVAKRDQDGLQRDRDEIRRLVFMMEFWPADQPYYEIGGTLVNALANHQKVCTAAEALDVIPRAFEGDEDARAQLRAWATFSS